MAKPSLDEFEDAISRTGGNLTNAAGLLGVTRQTIHNWLKDDNSFKEAVNNSRKKLFDKCLDVAYAVAMGIPRIDKKTGEFTGWSEKPDSQMLRYLLSVLGRDEGFGEKLNVNVDNPIPTVINIVKRTPERKTDE